MRERRRVRRLRGGMLALTAALLTNCGDAPEERLLVIGIDGMDPAILQRLMDAGQMPNFRALAEAGAMASLETTMPPQSPVAWSSFITSLPPSGHGIFDFVHRDPQSLELFLSTSRVDDGAMRLQRSGVPFWDLLTEAGIATTIFRVPANFPPSPGPSTPWLCGCSLRAFAGMGTPDLLGTYGSFTLYTDGEYRIPEGVDGGGDVLTPGARLAVPGGQVVSTQLIDGTTSLAIQGPAIDGQERTAQARLFVDRQMQAVHLSLPDEDHVLRAGEWSPWLELDFGSHPGRIDRVAGIARFYLRSTDPLWLYVTPVNLHPQAPLMPISEPEDEAAKLAEEGLYYTQGMPADTKALEAAVFSEAEFLAQVELTLQERERHLRQELRRFEGGVLFFYVHSLDQVSHMLWRAADRGHPGHHSGLQPYATAIDDHYQRMDDLLGMAQKDLDDPARAPATILVLSDHGFASYRRSVNLNRWLADEGFLVLTDSSSTTDLMSSTAVDWSRTRAYALGLNAVYVNRVGRESSGIVAADDVPALLDELATRLEAATDPQDGAQVVRRVYRVPSSDGSAVAPDLLIGYAPGYRSSGDSAIGQLEATWIADNLSAWSGDHCMAADSVPGVLLSSRAFASEAPALWDVPVSILDHFGVDVPAGVVGRTIWRQ